MSVSSARVSVTALLLGLATGFAVAEEPADRRTGTFRSATTASQFSVSPALRTMAVKPPPEEDGGFFGTLMVDPGPPGKVSYGPQDRDGSLQGWRGAGALPSPIANFNVGTGGANPPDPVGDVGPNHYVRMANSSFQIFDKVTGASVFGPANINTLFTGFGGACEFENAGDPIVLYDQLADRWLLTQFSDSVGPAFHNCVALSQTSDPTGPYYRWAFNTAVFPDYPKYGVWPNAYVISTREVDVSQIGAYAINRSQMLAGNPNPTQIQFIVPVDEFSGDGLLPTDLDGNTPPPAGAPAYFVGSMDDGGPYGAAQDALSLWEFDIDFATPANSSFELVDVIPIAPYDTIYPCLAGNARACIPVPAPLTAVDILSYRQRPMNRAAYRNYGSYQSIVTNQSVEAAPAIAGMRWWEIRNPGADSVLYQDSTFAPGVSDGIHRWMGSAAQDSSGNVALGYSAASPSLFPSVRYTARLEHDALNEMAQGEDTFVVGGGSRTGATVRWGDYTSMNIDPVDDCTFWFVNMYYAATGTQWTMRAGSFRFPDCGTPNLGVAVTPRDQRVCAGDTAVFGVEAHGYNGFTSATDLAVSSIPGADISFTPATIDPVPGISALEIDTTDVASGSYSLTVSGESTSPAFTRSREVSLTVDAAAPLAPTGTSPPHASVGQPLAPLLTWTGVAQAQSYVVEVATDAGFAAIVFTSAPITDTSLQLPPVLTAGTTYFWRVVASNSCGEGARSEVSSFTTRFAPGVCGVGDQIQAAFSDDVESGTNGWTTSAGPTTWTRSTLRPDSGSFSWLAVDVATATQQRLVSPQIAIPATGNSATLRFEHDVNMEPNTATTCWDGGFVEISTNNGGNWSILGEAAQLQDFYVGPIPTGEPAYCGTRPYRTASFDLSPFTGQTVRLRFSAITDTSVGLAPLGWFVDDIRVESCQLAPNEAPTIDAPLTLAGVEDVPLPVSGYSLGDADAGTDPVQLAVSATVGSLTATNGGGVTVAGSGSANIVLTGSLSALQSFVNAGALTFSLGANANGAATLTSVIDDLGNNGAGGPLTDQVATTVSIASVDDAPVAVADAAAAIAEDAASTVLSVLANDTDVDAGPITVQSVGSVTPVGAGVAAVGGGGSNVSFTPAANFCGTGVSFAYTLNGGSSAAVSFAVTCVNDAPVTAAALPDVERGEESALSIATASGFSDVDNASLSYAMSSVPALPAGVSIDSASGVISGVPGLGTAGDYVITVTASDAAAASAQQSFTLTILAVDIFANGFEQ
jgi:hypothetical protein